MNDKALAVLPEARTNAAKDVVQHGHRLINGLPSDIDKHQFMHAMITAANEADLKDCTGQSVLMAAYGACKLGLTPGKIEGLAYFVPFKGECTLIVGYQGYLALAQRNGFLKSMHCDVVYEGDEFEFWTDETGPRILHRPRLDRDVDKDNVVAAYCISQLSTGGRQIRVLTPKEIAKAKPNHKYESDAYKYHPHEMRLKAVIRRAAKHWRKTREISMAIAWDEQAERGERQQIGNGDLADITGEATAPPANPNQIGSLLGDDEQPGPDDTSQYSDDPAGDSGPVTDDDIDSMMDK